MTRPPFTIEYDEPQQLLKLRLFGLWELETLDRYTDELNRIFGRIAASGGSPKDSRILVDLREHGIQSREVASEIETRLSRGAAVAKRHAVLVSESALHKMQAARAGSQIQARFFTDEQAAVDWLLEDPAPKTAPARR